jgi:Raf kinase inhibitor-like YbhB/YbcL family protein
MGGASAVGGAGGKSAGGNGGTGGAGAMTLTSSVITEGGMFPAQNTCATTANDSPDLTWTAGPSGTMSYAVVLFDTTMSIYHWAIWDIPASVTMLPAKLDDMAMPATPAGAKQNSFQGNTYQGPCPSGTDHVYRFTVYALPVATLSGVTTSSAPMQVSTAITNAKPLASAALSAHSSASRAN